MLDSLVEKANDVLDELVWVVYERRMVGAFKNEQLWQALLVEFVSLDDLICSICTKPVLVTVAESNREGQVRVT